MVFLKIIKSFVSPERLVRENETHNNRLIVVFADNNLGAFASLLPNI